MPNHVCLNCGKDFYARSSKRKYCGRECGKVVHTGDRSPMKNPEIAKKVADKQRGKPKSEESKKKISNTLKEKFRTGELNADFWKKHTPESREKARLAKIGKHHSPDTEFKKGDPRLLGKNNPMKDPSIAKKLSGSNNFNWKGGITPQTRKDRASYKYQQWRKNVYIRDNYTCQSCGQIGGKLHVHHIKEWANYPDLRYEISNGQTLCIPCHKKTPNYAGSSK